MICLVLFEAHKKVCPVVTFELRLSFIYISPRKNSHLQLEMMEIYYSLIGVLFPSVLES